MSDQPQSQGDRSGSDGAPSSAGLAPPPPIKVPAAAHEKALEAERATAAKAEEKALEAEAALTKAREELEAMKTTHEKAKDQLWADKTEEAKTFRFPRPW